LRKGKTKNGSEWKAEATRSKKLTKIDCCMFFVVVDDVAHHRRQGRERGKKLSQTYLFSGVSRGGA
jgi:hypothetical protein